MQTVRLYDAPRTPQSWMQIIQPTEFAAFARLTDSGAVCDADGVPTSADEAVCIIFKTLPDAEAFCRERVLQIPALRFEIVDAAGPLRAPLFTIVHPSRTAALDGSGNKIRWSHYAAIAFLGIGPVLIWFDWKFYDGIMVMPTILGINLLLIAIRLLIMNASHRLSERDRRRRVDEARRCGSSAS